MKRLAIANTKGGPGKSTVAVELAYTYMRWFGLRVVILDGDFQGTATNFCTEAGATPYEQLAEDCCITALLDESKWPDTDKIVHKLVTMPGLAIIRANYAWKRATDVPVGERAKKLPLIDELLEELNDDYDLAVIDVPAHSSFSASMAIAAADFVLTPTRPTKSDIFALPQTRQLINEVNAAYARPRGAVKWLALLVCQIQKIRNAHRIWRDFLKDQYPELALIPPGADMPIELPLIGKLDEAPMRHLPESSRASSLATQVFKQLAVEVARRMALPLPEAPGELEKKPQKRRA